MITVWTKRNGEFEKYVPFRRSILTEFLFELWRSGLVAYVPADLLYHNHIVNFLKKLEEFEEATKDLQTKGFDKFKPTPSLVEQGISYLQSLSDLRWMQEYDVNSFMDAYRDMYVYCIKIRPGNVPHEFLIEVPRR